MKKCLDCNRNISDSANRTVRCKLCQKEFRKHKDEPGNKRRGTVRRTKELNQWGKKILNMSKDEIVYLVTQYRKQIKHCKDHNKMMELKTRIKILTDRYGILSVEAGASGNTSDKCEKCKFNNRALKICTLGNDPDSCKNFKYDDEHIYVELNNTTKDAVDDENAYPNDEEFIMPATELTIRKRAALPHSERINWDRAKTGWTNYYDDGLVTLSPDVFFGKWKKVD